jgi:hypothetical protein
LINRSKGISQFANGCKFFKSVKAERSEVFYAHKYAIIGKIKFQTVGEDKDGFFV